jgi:phenylacetate-coenzyme A ligase PaaK-like adenylate-forming protein
VDKFGILSALKRFEKQHLPVRLVGFPSYLYFLLKALKQEGISLSLNKNSLVLLGGGWKQFDDQTIGKQELYALAEETLGIKSANCRDFYSALEHSIAYAECNRHHFHVPIWSRVIIRDIKTLEPVGYDTPGFLSFVTPLVLSAPLISVTMGDIAVLRQGCGCGIKSPYFEVLGRAGKSRNCAVAASEWMGAK